MADRSFIKIFFTFLITIIMLNSIGQTTLPANRGFAKNWQVNYNLGFTQFYGDASNNGYFKKFSGEIAFATGATVRKYINPVFGLGLNLFYSGLKSHKEKSATGTPVNYELSGSYYDGNVNLLVDFTSLFWGPSLRKLSVYGITGLGYASWNSELVDSISGIIKHTGDPIDTDSYKKGGFVVPVGLGINYMLGDSWALNFEMNLRTVINDDVDVWRDGFKYDQPLYTSIGISYFINRKVKTEKVVSKPQVVEKKMPKEKPVEPIPFYDYRMQSAIKKTSGSKEPGVIIIDVPVAKKVEIPSGVIYRVQVLAKRNKLQSFNYLREKYNIVGDIYENYQDGVYRYSTGSFATYNEALKHSYLMKDKGVYDAFVIAFRYDKRIVISSDMKK
ncbi:MAG: outer membrane beta-barrel protein [Bacteroidetes bacterium]|nr:outer membrane beta-barrel protein [Bacteroidota bacterium]